MAYNKILLRTERKDGILKRKKGVVAMIDFRNPYTPGAGCSPQYLAGRDEILQNARYAIDAIAEGYPARSFVYYGLRGVGKTVILNHIEEYAEEQELLCRHIEVKDGSDFVKQLSIACTGFVSALSLRENLKEKLGKLISVLRAFSATYNPEDKTISLELKDVPLTEISTAGSGNLENDFTELLVTLGKYAKQAGTAICFCIDEIQYATENELSSLIAADHRINQLGLPVIFFCAGLPKILKNLGDAGSYAERLFSFVEIGRLSEEDSSKAIRIPAERLGVRYTDEAIRRIIQETDGYPYFIQELCSTIWKNHDSKEVDANAVNANIDATNAILDKGFFRVRYDRCTNMEKQFMAAMASCDTLPCNIGNVARIMDNKTNSISIYRSQLISKGLIYSTSHGEIDFTVPQFSAFLKRTHPEMIKEI